MITDVYTIKDTGSAADAIDGLVKFGRTGGMKEESLSRMEKLGLALLQIAEGLANVSLTQLWMETRADEAVVHLKVQCMVDLKEEDHLKALSTTGENTERKGFFEKIKGAFSELAIAENEELNDTGYVPEPGLTEYPVYWAFAPYTPLFAENWNREASAEVRKLADQVDVGFSSEQVEIAAHMKRS